MKPEELQTLLEALIQDWEGEVVEFKQAGNDFDTDKIGRYFSALCNEANLSDLERAGWFLEWTIAAALLWELPTGPRRNG